MTDERRAGLRRRLLWAGVLPLLLVLAFSAKVGVALFADDHGRSSFAEGRFDPAVGAFAVNARLNLFEPWISPFDEGTATYRLADFERARILFTDALETVPPQRACLVRINLGLSLEALGDIALAGGDRAQ